MRQNVTAKRVDERELKFGGNLRARTARLFTGTVYLAQNAVYAAKKPFSLRRQLDLALMTLKEGDLKIFFELCHRAAECGLCHVQHPCCARKVANVCHNLKVF